MRSLRTVFALMLVLALAAGAQAEDYGWTLSLSSTDPNVNQGPAGGPFTTTTVYLHLACSRDPIPGGVAAAEFDILFSGGVFPGAPVLVYPDMLNGGAGNNFQLAIGGCPTGGVFISWGHLNTDGTGLDGCLTGANQSVDCDPITPTAYSHAYRGVNTQGLAPCEAGTFCPATPVDATSWGSVKSLYR